MDVNSIEDELILDVLGEEDSAAWVQLDKMRFLSAEEVLNLDLFLVLGNNGIDWEMCVNQSHFVEESL